MSKSTREDLGGFANFKRSWGNEQFALNEGKVDFPPRYKAFQKAIKELADNKKVFPIEYDFFIWNITQ